MRQVEDFSHLSYDRNLVTAAGGNVSMRCGDLVVITASGVSLRNVDEGGIIICDLDGNVLGDDHGLRPSKELHIHLDIYKVRPEVRGVIHVHPPYAVAYTYHGKEIPMATGSAEMKLKRVPIVPYAWPGTGSLAQMTAEAVSGAGNDINCVVLQRHGIVAYEQSLEAAFNVAELTEDTARIATLAGV